MTGVPLSLPAHAPGRIDVFAIDLPASEAEALTRDPDLIATLLGARPDPSRVEAFDTAVLGDLGLAGYLVEGMGVAEADVDEHARALGDINHALVLRAGAFDRAVTLQPQDPLSHVVTLYEEAARLDLTPLRSASADGQISGPAPTPASGPRPTRWLWVCLALATALLVAVVWPVFLSL